MRLTTDEIAAATGGARLGPPVEVDGASIDSRRGVTGTLFVPIVAARDGHDFIDAAHRAGAAAYLTARPDTTGRAAVRVDDTLAALVDLGRLARSRVPDRVVGVTGSVGKTSTKDLLAHTLATTYPTTANQASFNNEMGVPLTLLSSGSDTEAVVCEMGARGIGHIAMLCEVARPTVGIVTAIAGAHMEMFGSLEQVAVAKGELVEALPSSGTAILNADYHLVARLRGRTAASVLTYGIERHDADLYAESIEVDAELRPSFVLHTPWGSADVRLTVHGFHQVSNALGAAGGALAMGVELDAVVAGLADATLSPMRMDVRRRSDGLIVIDDSYNANPTSMEAALRGLAAIDADRRIAVLGAMAELGDEAEDDHRRIGEFAESLGIAVIAVGTTGYGPRAHVVGDTGEAIILLGGASLGPGDAVLVKGSRIAGLDVVARKLA
ncbi:MAG: UDP-N-acetylmuramoyl-tripeptide--D-alanyl-D-alanine ligase [Actinobacteria bacterium]|nr:UDP-N-acetylmuramoyl-tripeptide--D-alanyl-D-alanine ligase [Actinomycetota bacterium]